MFNLNLQSLIPITIASCFFSLLPMEVKAAQITTNSQGHITSIEDLNIEGNFYNVNFVYTSFQNLFGSPINPNYQPTFWLNPQGAKNARNAIDQVLESVYPASLATFDDQFTLDYLIPQKSALGLITLDQWGNPVQSPNIFGAVWGNYKDYYEGRQWSELLELIYQNGGICACIRNITINPETLSGTDVNAERLFATFTPVAAESIPEPLTILGISTAIGFGAAFKRKLNQKLDKH